MSNSNQIEKMFPAFLKLDECIQLMREFLGRDYIAQEELIGLPAVNVMGDDRYHRDNVLEYLRYRDDVDDTDDILEHYRRMKNTQ